MVKPLESLEDILIQTLLEMDVITPGFTGTITLHIANLGLSDIDRYEKSLKRKKRCDNKDNRDEREIFISPQRRYDKNVDGGETLNPRQSKI